jgi:hypothetical protein
MFDDGEQYATLFGLAVAGLLLAYVWWRPDFVIRVRDGRCHCRGKLALVVQRAFAQFLLHDLKPGGPVTISGKYHQRRLRLRFRGNLTPGQKQRIRNFLLTHR